MLINAIKDTLTDGIRLLPFLLLTYLLMEYIEHKAGAKAEAAIRKSGKWGPVLGGVLGIVPQCGFSTAASNFYAGRMITRGTLLAVFLSTSDEMLPVFLSERVPFPTIASLLAAKLTIGAAAGFLIDLTVYNRKKAGEEPFRIEHLCDHEHCHCREGKIFRSALNHTLQVFGFILLISFLLNLLIGWVGEEVIASLLSSKPVLGPLIAGLIGLIPNCAASVIITQLYLEGVLNAGSLLAGLLAGTGVGLLVLFRVNDDWKENVKILLLLYGIGVICGIGAELLGISF